MSASRSRLHRLTCRLSACVPARAWLYAALALCFIGLSFAYEPATIRMGGDQSIQLYVAQRMLHGAPPYVSALYAKTPLTPILTAGMLAVGRPLGIGDVLSSRLIFILLGAIEIFAVGMAASAILAALPWRHGHALPALGGLVAAAGVLGNGLTVSAAAMGLEPKLIVAGFGMLSIWLVARRSWTWAGLCAALAFLAWQPAGIFAAGVGLAAILQRGQPRWLAALRTIAGILAPIAAVGLYLGLAGALPAAWRQAGFTPAAFGTQVAKNPGLWSRLVNEAYAILYLTPRYFGAARPFFLLGVAGWIVTALLAPAWIALTQRVEAHGWLRRLWLRLTAPSQVPLLVAGVGFGGFSLFDFQAGPDFLPLVPLAAIGLAGLAVIIVDAALPTRFALTARVAPALLCFVLIAPGLIGAFFAPIQSITWPIQVAETEKLEALVGRDTEVQYFSCLVPLVLRDRANATPYIHLGVKHLWLLAQELGTLEDLADLLDEREIAVVVDAGNTLGRPVLHDNLLDTYDESVVEPALRICTAARTVDVILTRKDR